ncbi:hypothetical protein DBR06_SOUSAS49610001, partial [Sousa chinensis]
YRCAECGKAVCQTRCLIQHRIIQWREAIYLITSCG